MVARDVIFGIGAIIVIAFSIYLSMNGVPID